MLSLDNVNDNVAFQIYPNPASDHFTISFKEKRSQSFSLKITDNLGKEIYSEIYLPRNFVTIDTKSFSKGIYFLTITSQEKIQICKLIIK